MVIKPIVILMYMNVVNLSFNLSVDGAKMLHQDSECSCETNEGTIDLSPLSTGSIPALVAKDSKKQIYFWDPCRLFSKRNNTVQEDAQDVCTDVLACQEGNKGGHFFPLSTGKDAKFQKSTLNATRKGATGIELLYSGDAGPETCRETNNKRVFHVVLVCGQGNKFEAIGEYPSGVCNYIAILTSEYCCPGYHGISVGSVLVILFFSFSIAYIVSGIIYKHFGRGATGIEVIPNLTFWRTLPGLVKDGIMFTIRFGKQGETGYQNI